MKNYLYILSLLLLSFPTYASSHRFGIGIQNSAYLPKNVALVEYGYEFNSIIGFNLSGSSYSNYYYEDQLKYDGTYVRVASDIGYTFEFNGWDLKPYTLVGMVNLNESNTLSNSSTLKLQIGAGIRATLDFGLYIDLSAKTMDLDHRDGNESSLTIGYKF